MKKTLLILGLAALSGCTQIIVPEPVGKIILQHPVTREVFVCDSDSDVPTDICAAELEEAGFVRLTDKPTFPGKNDIPERGSYPTRRYRDRESAPRW